MTSLVTGSSHIDTSIVVAPLNSSAPEAQDLSHLVPVLQTVSETPTHPIFESLRTQAFDLHAGIISHLPRLGDIHAYMQGLKLDPSFQRNLGNEQASAELIFNSFEEYCTTHPESYLARVVMPSVTSYRNPNRSRIDALRHSIPLYCVDTHVPVFPVKLNQVRQYFRDLEAYCSYQEFRLTLEASHIWPVLSDEERKRIIAVLNSPMFNTLSNTSISAIWETVGARGDITIAQAFVNAFIQRIIAESDYTFLSTGGLYELISFSIKHEAMESIPLLIKHVNFHLFLDVLQASAYEEDATTAQVLINSMNPDIFIHVARVASATMDTTVVQMLIDSSTFSNLPTDQFIETLGVLIRDKQNNTVLTLMDDPRFTSLSPDEFVRLFSNTHYMDHNHIVHENAEVAHMLIYSPTFSQLSVDHLRSIISLLPEGSTLRNKVIKTLRQKMAPARELDWHQIQTDFTDNILRSFALLLRRQSNTSGVV